MRLMMSSLGTAFLLNLTMASAAEQWVMLPGQYANCISQKSTAGVPKLNGENVICLRDSLGNLMNAYRNGRPVFNGNSASLEKSDAVDACRAIGKRLPSRDDFMKIMETGYQKISAMSDGASFATTLVSKDEPEAYLFFDSYIGTFAWGSRSEIGRVLCVN